MADVTLYDGEKRYVQFPVTATIDPLTDDVFIAFIAEAAEPQPGDWQAAIWTPGQTWQAGQPVYAAVTIGPGGIDLDPGTYCAVLRIPDGAQEPWIPAGTVRIRTGITLTTLRAIRREVGTTPADDEIADLYAALQSIPAVAIEILRPRYADALAAAGGGGLTIPGVITVTAPAQPTALAEQIARLEAQLAAEQGIVDDTGLAATSVVAGRFDRVR